MIATSSRAGLQNLFPSKDLDGLPESVRDELAPDENALWIGGPDRWGLFRATPFVLILAGAFGALAYWSAGSDASARQYLTMMASTQSGTDALILPGLAAGYLVILALAMRDPRGRWTYMVTDRRLLTFYKGRKLRELYPESIDRLKVLTGIEGRLRRVGDVVWQRGGGGVGEAAERGPDQGQRGFRGMREPDMWKARLEKWAEVIRSMSASDARAFARSLAGETNGETASGGARELVNRRYGFALTVPERWVGRIGLQQTAPLRILGLVMPFKQVIQRSKEPLHDPPEAWNFIAVNGRSGLKFKLHVNPGPPVATFETSRDRVGDKLIEADGDLRCGPLAGYRFDYRYLDKLYCRFAMLSRPDFHVLVNVTFPVDQAGELVPAVEAVFDSIRDH